jgi:uncharacterized protein YycO
MKVAFLRGTSFFDKLIKGWTGEKYSHCELVFSDGVTIGNSLKSPFRVESKKVNYNKGYWDFIEIKIDLDQEIKMRTFCNAQIGKEYDWKAIWFSQFIPLKFQDDKRWFCSELCVAALQQIKYLPYELPSEINPGEFYRLILKYEYFPIEI